MKRAAAAAAAAAVLLWATHVGAADLVCRADDPGAAAELDAALRSGAMLAVPAPTPGVRYISAGEVLRRQRNGERIHLIDPRPNGLGGSLVVEPALRMSAAQLKAQTPWRDEAVVLIGSGAAYRAIEALQQALQRDGFVDVSILDGGARVWWTDVERKRLAPSDLPVEPESIDLYGDAERWTIVDLASNAPPLPTALTRVAVSQLEPEAAARVAAAEVRALRGRPNVLVVAEDDGAALAVAERLATQVRANVYVLSGGWAAQLRHERRLRQLHAGAGNAAQQGRACW